MDDRLQHGTMAERDGRTITILVTDDDEATRELYRDTLEFQGYAVDSAGSGDECIEQAVLLRPALILLDMKMPGRDGFSTAAELRLRPETETIPILAVTGVAGSGEVERARRAGCDAVLNKPVLPRDLLEAIRALLELNPPFGIRERAALQREHSEEMIRRSYRDLRAFFEGGEAVTDTEIRQWVQGAQVSICSLCQRVRLPRDWRTITPELLLFLESWTTLSHGICPECMEREYPHLRAV